MSLPSPPRCILNKGHSVHPCFCCFFNLELKTSVHQTLGSISLWSSAYSNHFRTCCAGVCFSGWAVWAQMKKKKKEKRKAQHPKNQQKFLSVWSPYCPEPTVLGRNLILCLLDLLFIFWTSGVPHRPAQTPSSLLTVFMSSKVNPNPTLAITM